MAIAVVQDYPGLWQDDYDALRRELGLERTPPPGLVVHAAGPTVDGWRVVEVWESFETHDDYVADRLGPAVRRAVGPHAPTPRVQVTPVHALVR